MSRKSKIEPALKVELVERYLKEEIALCEAARRAGLKSEESFAHWVSVYLSEGVVGLLGQAKKKLVIYFTSHV